MIVLKAGAGRSEIFFPEDFFPVEGFSTLCSPLYARTAVLHDEKKIAILSLELTSLPQEEVDELKKILSEETMVKEANCFICVTHTFSAPHIMPDKILKSSEARNKKGALQRAIYTAARESARKAMMNIALVLPKLGQSECHVNINRDFETPDGWWVSNCGTGPSDKTLTAICMETEAGKPSLILIHYSVQSSVLDDSRLPDGGKAVSSDLAGVACATLEEQYPGAIVMFLLGAAGDQAPVEKAKTLYLADDGSLEEKDIGAEGLNICRELGLKMAESSRLAIEAAMPLKDTVIKYISHDFFVPSKQMKRNLHELIPTRTYEYKPDGQKQISIEALSIGPVALLCVKPELNCVTAMEIVEKAPFEVTLVLTMVNGGAKYMADASSYERITYEAMNSPFALGAAEILSEESLKLLSNLINS
ncbi:MAG: hypothetical protein GX034_00065 [Clostridiaceae bacterium]|nr:hypothetical protein [Clostridiaceae bacterium]